MDFGREVEEFAREAEDRLGDRLVYLVLYGSVSRGEAHDESDVDLFAVVRDEGAKEDLFNIAADFLKRGVLFSLMVSTRERYDDEFLEEVTREGEVLYGSVKKVRERAQPGR